MFHLFGVLNWNLQEWNGGVIVEMLHSMKYSLVPIWVSELDKVCIMQASVQ